MLGEDRKDEQLVRRAVVRFAAVSGALLLVVVAAMLVVADRLAERSRADEARARGEALAAAVELQMQDHSRASHEELTRSIEAHARQGGVRAVLVWNDDGTVVWATRQALLGERYRFDSDVAELFEESGPSLVVDEGERLDAARPTGLLGNEIEVFTPIVDQNGQHLVVEAYVDPAALGATRGEVVGLVLPVGLATLLLFEGLAMLALWGVVRRVAAGRRARIRTLTKSLAAVDQERRRLAHDLHDGIVQDLAATRYALAGVAQSLAGAGSEEPSRRLHRISDLLAEELAKLRALLGELIVPDVGSEPLATAMASLVGRLVPPELEWRVEVDPALEAVDRGTAGVVHRVVQEGVRNAVRHGRPSTVTARVTELPADPEPWIQVLLDDDGVGITQGADAQPDHYGLQLVGDLVRGLGGSMALEDLGPGTRLRVEWPRVPEPA